MMHLRSIFGVLLLLQITFAPHTIAQDEDSDIVFKSSDDEFYVQKSSIDSLKSRFGLKSDAEILIHEMHDNTIKYGNREYPLTDLKKMNMFTNDATYMHDGVISVVPTHLDVYKRTDKEEVLTAFKSESGNFDSIIISDRSSGTSKVEFVFLNRNVYAEIESDQYDYQSMKIQHSERDDDSLHHSVDEFESDTSLNRMACTEWNMIELAVAYDSTFCAENGGTSEPADIRATSIVSMASEKFQVDNLCTFIKITHLEGYCNPSGDIYAEMLNLNKSGCGNDGLIDEFQDLWNSDRPFTQRDVAYLFAGKGIECDSNGDCMTGCAFENGICTGGEDQVDIGYGVIWATFSESIDFLGVSLAHELGHNCGASHVGGVEDLMFEDFNKGSEFSDESIQAMLAEFASKGDCVKNVDEKVVPPCRNGLLRAFVQRASKP